MCIKFHFSNIGAEFVQWNHLIKNKVLYHNKDYMRFCNYSHIYMQCISIVMQCSSDSIFRICCIVQVRRPLMHDQTKTRGTKSATITLSSLFDMAYLYWDLNFTENRSTMILISNSCKCTCFLTKYNQTHYRWQRIIEPICMRL